MTVQHADTHASLTECVGRHVPATHGAERLEWLPVLPPLEHVRVLEHTCEQCRPMIGYEFCQLGGAFIIRRTDHRSRRIVVHQTAPVRRALAWEWWQQLLYGLAI